MLVLGIFSLMIAVALPTVKISPLLLIRVTSIILLYAAALSFNAMYIQAIGSGLGIYSGLFQVTSVSQAIDVFLFTIGALVLLPWAPANIFSGSRGNTNSTAITINSRIFTNYSIHYMWCNIPSIKCRSCINVLKY